MMRPVSRYPRLYKDILDVDLENLRSLEVNVLNKGVMSATHIRHELPYRGTTKQYVQEDAYFISLQLRELQVKEHWCNGRRIATDPYAENNVSIYDMRDAWSAKLDAPFESFICHVTQDSLNALADAHGAPRIHRLVCAPAHRHEDILVRQFADLLIPAAVQDAQPPQLFVGHLLLALHEHLAMAYGNLDPHARLLKGALAPWHYRRATEFMLANLSHNVSLEQIATDCGLSVNHFVRAFTRSTGETPHRWLMQRRVDAAIELMRRTDSSLADISLLCGFSDQSHFNRWFSARTGITPGLWRKKNCPATKFSDEADSLAGHVEIAHLARLVPSSVVRRDESPGELP
ncbi:helix-turn-helix domain-containing protein [Cupriavidus sp. 30B13]|uniref:helix-turn-helix domain-containing protein n=1 Tax=Cupriavidus sp. 30B13 TaxID=3384241 RepID=UPI003B90F62B